MSRTYYCSIYNSISTVVSGDAWIYLYLQFTRLFNVISNFVRAKISRYCADAKETTCTMLFDQIWTFKWVSMNSPSPGRCVYSKYKTCISATVLPYTLEIIFCWWYIFNRYIHISLRVILKVWHFIAF